MPSLRGRVARRLFSIRVLTSLVIVSMMLVIAAVLMWHGARSADRVLVKTMEDSVQQLAITAEERTRRLVEPGQGLLRLLAFDPLVQAQTLPERLERLPALAEALQVHDVASAIYIGYDNGDFLLLRPWRPAALPLPVAEFSDVEEGAWLVQSVTQGAQGTLGEWRLLDTDMRQVASTDLDDYRFDPRERPWYHQALTDETRLTRPYVFFTTREVGVTLSRRASAGGAVVGMDATVTDLGEEMASLKLTPGTQLAIASESGEVLAYPDLDRLLVGGIDALRLATLEELSVPALASLTVEHAEGRVHEIQADGEAWFAMRLTFQAMGDQLAWLLVAIPADEVLADSRTLLGRQALIAGGMVVLLLPVGLWLGRRIGRPLHELGVQVRALGSFDFAACRGVESRIVEVRQLSGALTSMMSGLADFRDMMRTLSSEPELEVMLERVLVDLTRVTNSDHGAIYLVDEPQPNLLRRVALTGEPEEGEPLPETYLLQASEETGDLDRLQQALQAQNRLAFPLRDRDGHRMGMLVLTLQNARLGSDVSHWTRFVKEISGAAAVAIEMRRLLEAEQRLLDALVKMMARAIDIKSPHTGAHCSRVPVLAEMLLDRVAQAREGPFADITPSPQDRYSFHLAAWLHDCGKLTTPDAVMEKGTRLETRYDRIHEIRTRFEVLWRDAEIDYWRALAKGDDDDRLRDVLNARHSELQAAFTEVANANLGSVVMDEASAARLEEIAEWRWWRHFDDRLGVSGEEAERMAREPRRALPAEESLLADRPRDLIEWPPGRRPAVQADDVGNRWHFDMPRPAHAGHQGELYNLLVKRGTLNDIERFRIQEHIVQTIIMLESLPWPAQLRRVPVIAGSHHERMDGEGYPRRLRLEAASVEERVLAVADVFEALTAADRPYKAGLSLSTSLQILAEMVRDGHLDGELFALMLDSGLWRDYARQYMSAAQVDSVDIDALYRLAGLRE
ncbi:HD domain-containing phosphohydrolase [Halomonas urumqiensis]|uniref:Phosphohydrolase n=1 Tax=Halomonas urumqiensis TaxID=1684789 RepID=A0A2N7UKB8_9GAMM|nr:HD domain-containing phosphohydrolase [Halomonas urumqiensis]PMR80883.1 hypothetical protein C1H70_07425 [Halomonas urumqiensis]PTB02839.1 hypothetical protein C6V82_09425 [Halomonas urumqiensis]GHE21353.1 hypothetical protein GCM10017767_18740 [Halomonas urumqiensis]